MIFMHIKRHYFVLSFYFEKILFNNSPHQIKPRVSFSKKSQGAMRGSEFLLKCCCFKVFL